MATLYHWDLPQAIEDRGGWASVDSVNWFAEYAALMFRELDDRVPLWATINEPWVVVNEAYVEGRHAPGRRDWSEAALVSKNLLKAHAAAVVAVPDRRKTFDWACCQSCSDRACDLIALKTKRPPIVSMLISTANSSTRSARRGSQRTARDVRPRLARLDRR